MTIIHVFQEGGIGDLIITLPLIQQIFKEQSHIFKINLYTSFPEIAHYFLPWINASGDLSKANQNKKNFDYFISLTDMVFFTKKPNATLPDFLKEIYNSWLSNSTQWDEYLKAHPLKANAMAHKALSLGQTRWTLPFNFLGMHYQPYIWEQEVKDIHIPKQYITIHDGFDASNYYKFMRSTKSWGIDYWESLIKIFKEKYPNIAVIQLGGIKHQKIKGVDINFAGQLSFEKSLEYLKSSLVHIDGDSGLVHARRLFKKPSIVLFGPTNHKYFGYPENINMIPKFCGDCWWLNRDWMENCKEKYETPKCMDSIEPMYVMHEIKNIFDFYKDFHLSGL